jgi:hypothetical protein
VLQSITASLVRMAIQQILAMTIGKSFQAASTAATVAQMAAIGAAAAGPAALVSLATSGANAVGAQAGIASTVGLATVLGAPKKLGGRIFGPGGPTSDRIMTPSSAGEYMVNTRAAQRVGYDTLDYINQRGELPMGSQRAIRPMNVAAARPGGAGGSAFSRDDIAMLRGIVAEAVHAMPAVVVHPVVDSAEVGRNWINSKSGERDFLAHLDRNSGRVKATLNRP